MALTAVLMSPLPRQDDHRNASHPAFESLASNAQPIQLLACDSPRTGQRRGQIASDTGQRAGTVSEAGDAEVSSMTRVCRNDLGEYRVVPSIKRIAERGNGMSHRVGAIVFMSASERSSITRALGVGAILPISLPTQGIMIWRRNGKAQPQALFHRLGGERTARNLSVLAGRLSRCSAHQALHLRA